MIKLKYKDINGFTAVETTLILTAIIFIGVVGWIVYSHYNKSNSSLILNRQEYVDKYISDITQQNYTSFGTSLYQRGYLTSSLYNTTQSLISSFTSGSLSSNPAYSKLICIDSIPSYYTYGRVSIASNGDTASIPVSVFALGSKTPTPYVAYWVKINSVWKLNDAKCS